MSDRQRCAECDCGDGPCNWIASAGREFLFEYRFGGSEWSMTIFANDPAEAREKIKLVGMARYKGEVFEKIPAAGGLGGIVARLLVWWRNLPSKAEQKR